MPTALRFRFFRKRLVRSLAYENLSSITVRIYPAGLSARKSKPPTSRPSTSQPFILFPHKMGIVRSFEPTDNEVTPCHLLEMVDEQDVDHEASGRTDYGYGLRSNFL